MRILGGPWIDIHMEGMAMSIRILTGILMFLILGCASASTTIYNKTAVSAITSWNVIFKYEPGEVEEKVSTSGDKETTVLHQGRSPQDLQLRDDIGYCLHDRHHINVVDASGDSVGIIRIHPVHFYAGGFKSADIEISEPSGQNVLARIRVKNGDRNATFKEDDSFARFVADKVSAALKRILAPDTPR